MVSTASRVGTGNIVGVSTAICIGGPGACFWMWIMYIIGASSAFMESTLAQIFKRKNSDGSCCGGPAYYIEKALHAKWLSMIFCVFLIATDFRSIFGGITGSCLVYGIKRGLFSNEAGVGSAPNASASAEVTHPAKQGLVQTLSVYIDTMLLCTATALMCLASGVPHTKAVAGAPYVQKAVETVFGSVGPIFITLAMVLFAFTTLIGNLFYVDNALIYMNGKKEPDEYWEE